jgi:hypothetical protein
MPNGRNTYLVEIAQHRHTITPAVLKGEAGFAVGAHNHIDAFIPPPVP